MFREPFSEPEVVSKSNPSPEEIRELIANLYKMEKQYGIVITAITRDDVTDAWINEFLADDKEAPPFTDELWNKFQDTYEWRKGFAEVMWDAVHQLMVSAMYDFVSEQELSEKKLPDGLE